MATAWPQLKRYRLAVATAGNHGIPFLQLKGSQRIQDFQISEKGLKEVTNIYLGLGVALVEGCCFFTDLDIILVIKSP